MSSVGFALRALGGGPVQVMTRVPDFKFHVDLKVGAGGVGQELVAFEAVDFCEVLANSDVWRFEVIEEGETRTRKMLVFMAGSDILIVRAESKLV